MHTNYNILQYTTTVVYTSMHTNTTTVVFSMHIKILTPLTVRVPMANQ